VTKDYDLSDLLISIPDFTDSPNFAGGTAGGTAPATQPENHGDAAAAAPADLVNSVTLWITSLARANEPSIEMARNDTAFSITATTDQHERIARGIADVLARRRTEVTLEPRFINLTPNAESKLAAAALEKLESVRAPGGSSAGTLLDAPIATAIIDAPQDDPGSSKLTAPRITLSNGQRAYVLVATHRSYTSGFTKGEGENQWEPVTDEVQTGVSLDARARADEGGKTIALHVQPELTKLLALRDEPYKAAPADQNLKVQVPVLDARKLDALASVPNGGTMLFYLPAPANVPNDGSRLYLLIKATVIHP
jgi:hypothetical protein